MRCCVVSHAAMTRRDDNDPTSGAGGGGGGSVNVNVMKVGKGKGGLEEWKEGRKGGRKDRYLY